MHKRSTLGKGSEMTFFKLKSYSLFKNGNFAFYLESLHKCTERHLKVYLAHTLLGKTGNFSKCGCFFLTQLLFCKQVSIRNLSGNNHN